MQVVQTLIDEHGVEKARLALLKFYSIPENLEHFALLFPDYVPTELAPFHVEILQMFQGEGGNKGAAAPRGFSKSTICDLIYLAWVALNGKKHFVPLISDTFTQAVMLLDALKTELENNETIKWLYGEVRGEEWSSENLIVKCVDGTECKIIAKGAGMKVRGLRFRNYRPDLVLIDDLENDELVESPDRRHKLMSWLKKGVLPALAKDIGEVIIIGTILHQDSLLSNVINQREGFEGWKVKKYQALDEAGQSLWPDRFSADYLLGMRDDPKHPFYLGPISFSQEMMNTPINEEDQIIKPEWCNVRYVLQEELNTYQQEHPEVANGDIKASWLRDTFRRVEAAVDPAISEKTSADYWAMVTTGIRKSDGHMYVLDIVRLRESDPIKQVNIILDQYQDWQHDRISVEAVAYQKGLYQLAKRIGAERGLYPPLHAFTPDKDKTRRAIMHSANFAGGLVHLRTDHPLFSVFLEEILQFPQGVHDDMFDAFMSSTEDTVMKSRRRVFSNKPSGF